MLREINTEDISESYGALKNSIYFDITNRRNFPILGADMFCGSWSKGKVYKKEYYFNRKYF